MKNNMVSESLEWNIMNMSENALPSQEDESKEVFCDTE